MVLPAPGRFSTTTCWPSARESFSVISRQMMSGVPPAACDTMNLTGRAGQVLCAGLLRGREQDERARQSDNQSLRNLPSFPALRGAGSPVQAPRWRAFLAAAAHDTIRSYREVDPTQSQDQGPEMNSSRRRTRASMSTPTSSCPKSTRRRPSTTSSPSFRPIPASPTRCAVRSSTGRRPCLAG